VQEALTNILRHAQAANVSVIVERRHDRMLVIVEDDGVGFDAEAMMNTPMKDRRLGLLGMQERVELIGGSLTIESKPGFGTTLYVRMPAFPRLNGGS